MQSLLHTSLTLNWYVKVAQITKEWLGILLFWFGKYREMVGNLVNIEQWDS